jgi:hypothetical protein
LLEKNSPFLTRRYFRATEYVQILTCQITAPFLTSSENLGSACRVLLHLLLRTAVLQAYNHITDALCASSHPHSAFIAWRLGTETASALFYTRVIMFVGAGIA